MILVPIRTVAGLNAREHHMVRARRVKKERKATADSLIGVTRPAIPCGVLLTRIAPGTVPLDDDNLVGACKHVRDAIAKWIGVDDREREQVRYEYGQERGPWGVRIEFKEMP